METTHSKQDNNQFYTMIDECVNRYGRQQTDNFLKTILETS